MGSSQSKRFDPPRLKIAEIQEFSKQSLFSSMLIEKLYGHFYRIASSQKDDGVIDFDEFCFIIQKAQNRSLAIERLFNLFDANHDGVINFREFIQGLSTFNIPDSFEVKNNQHSLISSAKLKEQIEVSFRIIDINNTKKIYMRDLASLLISSLKENLYINLSNVQVELIIKNTFENQSHGRDEYGSFFSFDDYSKLVANNPSIVKWLSADTEIIIQEIYKKNNQKSRSKCISL